MNRRLALIRTLSLLLSVTVAWAGGTEYFVAARGALDAAGEWWHDAERSELLFIAPGGGDPSNHEVSVKTRVAGFEGENASDVVIEGLEFRGCNVRFENCRRMAVRNCRFLYPSTPKVFPDGKTALEMQRNLRVTGEDNVLERLLIEWAVDGALEVEGSGSVLLVEDQSQLGGMATSGLVSHWLGRRTQNGDWVVGGIFKTLVEESSSRGFAKIPQLTDGKVYHPRRSSCSSYSGDTFPVSRMPR